MKIDSWINFEGVNLVQGRFLLYLGLNYLRLNTTVKKTYVTCPTAEENGNHSVLQTQIKRVNLSLLIRKISYLTTGITLLLIEFPTWKFRINTLILTDSRFDKQCII